MKKLALVLAVLVALSGASVFAEVSIGAFSAGDMTIMDSDNSQVLGPGWTDSAQYGSLGLSASNDVMGFNTGFEYGGVGFTALSLDYLTGWYTFMEGMIKVEAGKVDDGSYRLADFVYLYTDNKNDKYADEYGAAVTLSPMEGFSASVFLPATAEADYVDNFSSVNIAASYAIADTATILLQADLDAAQDYNYIWAGVDVTAVENLGLRITYANAKASHAGQNSEYSIFADSNIIKLSLQYGMDAITIAEDAMIMLSDADPKIASETKFAYGMDVAEVGAIVEIDYQSDLDWGVTPYVSKFMGNGVIGAAFDITSDGAEDMNWSLPVFYKLWF